MLCREEDRAKFRRVGLRHSERHNTDHRAVIGIFRGGWEGNLRRYRRKRRRFPIRLPKVGPHGEPETAFQGLADSVTVPPVRQRSYNEWISQRSWDLIDQKAALRKTSRRGRLSGGRRARLGCRIGKSLRRDWRKRTEDAAAEVEGHLAKGEIKEAWRLLKYWYREVEGRAPRPSLQTMEKQTAERVELYTKVPREELRAPLPINVEPFPISDAVPSEWEIREAVARLKNGRTGGASGMRAEDIKGWLRGAVREEEAVRRMMRGEAEDLGAGEGEGVEGAGDQWRALVSLVQAIWERGYIPHQMRWMIVVLLPKGGGNYRGKGLLEPIWKVLEGIMDKRLN